MAAYGFMVLAAIAAIGQLAAGEDRGLRDARARAIRGCPTDMVRVPAGTFRMGAPDGIVEQQQRHMVTLPDYCIDRTEVTVKAYHACAAARGCPAASHTVSWGPYSADDVKRFSALCNRDDRPDHPINCVSWDQAVAYCRWAGKRLPSEAEWEHAALGNDGRSYPWGSTASDARHQNACGTECVAMAGRDLQRSWRAAYDGDDGWVATAPVGSFPQGKSPFGAVDMAGNVWEWTVDWSPASAVAPRPMPDPPRVQRGGGWSDDGVADTRSAFRLRFEPPDRSADVGFRCARDPG